MVLCARFRDVDTAGVLVETAREELWLDVICWEIEEQTVVLVLGLDVVEPELRRSAEARVVVIWVDKASSRLEHGEIADAVANFKEFVAKSDATAGYNITGVAGIVFDPATDITAGVRNDSAGTVATISPVTVSETSQSKISSPGTDIRKGESTGSTVGSRTSRSFSDIKHPECSGTGSRLITDFGWGSEDAIGFWAIASLEDADGMGEKIFVHPTEWIRLNLASNSGSNKDIGTGCWADANIVLTAVL